MSIHFEPTKINGMSLSNRFVRSATWEGMAAADGTCTDRLSDFLMRLADGGVGLIIIGHSYVSREGQVGPWQLGIHDPAAQPGLTRLFPDNGNPEAGQIRDPDVLVADN